jgi:hypothetical protein
VAPVQNFTSLTVPPVSKLATKTTCATCGRNCFYATWSKSNPGNTGQRSSDVGYLEIPFRRSRINISASFDVISTVHYGIELFH